MQRINIFCLVFLLISVTKTVSAQNSPYQLTIDCIDSLLGEPVSNCEVKIAELNIIEHANQFGQVQFENLPIGQYRLAFKANGYHAFHKAIEFTQSMGIQIQLCPLHIHLHEATVSESNNTSFFKSKLYGINPILNKEHLFKTNALNWSQLLKALPGVYLIQTGPVNSIPVVRGLHTNRIVLVQQDIRLYNQQWGLEHAPEIGTANIDRIQLLRGPLALKYGSDAFGGVLLNIAPEYLKTAVIQSNTQMGFHSNNRTFSVAEFIQFRHQKVATQVSFSYKKGADAQSPNYVVSNTGFQTLTFQTNLLYLISKKATLENRFSFFQSKMGIAAAAHIGSTSDLYRAIHSSVPLLVAPATYNINKPYQDVRHQQYSCKLNYQLSKAHAIQGVYMLQYNQRSEFDKGVAWSNQSKNEPANAYHLLTQGLQFIYQYNTNQLQTEWGIDCVNGKNLTTGIQDPFIPNYSQVSTGAFGLTTFKYKQATIEGSYRFDYKLQQVYYRDPSNKVNAPQFNYTGNSFGLGVAIPVVSMANFQVSALKAWRAPAINEMFSNGLHNSMASYELGNVLLQTEQAFNLEAGMQFKWNKTSIKTNVFMNAIDGYIVSVPTGQVTLTTRGSFPTFQFNQQDAQFKGIEISLVQLIGSRFKFSGQAQLLDAIDKHTRLPIYGIPPNQLYASVSYFLFNKNTQSQLEFNLDWNAVNSQLNYIKELDFMSPPPAYHLIHFAAQVNVKQKFKIQFQVKNIFNVAYRDYMNRFRYFFDEPGRNFTIQCSIQI